ncbi:MAG: DUF4097 family beta strand repeat protein [Oscillospiraceae bacterium]|nr:DUF4097 family beta strand repeat protein [Oscillospiraceae bacterium]
MNRRNVLLIAGAAVGIGLLLILATGLRTVFRPFRESARAVKTENHEFRETLTGVDIKTFSSDVRFVVSDDGVTRVESVHGDDVKESVEVENGVLNVRQETVKKVSIHFFGFGVGDIDSHLTVSLPRGTFESLKLETASGDVGIPADYSFQSAEVATASGSVSFDAQCGKLLVGTASGDVRLREVRADSASIATASGEVELKDTRVTEKLTVATVSGDVEFEHSDAQEMELETVSGEVEGTLLTGKSFDVKTTSGKIEVPASTSGAGRCEIKTVSGDVKLRVDGIL